MTAMRARVTVLSLGGTVAMIRARYGRCPRPRGGRARRRGARVAEASRPQGQVFRHLPGAHLRQQPVARRQHPESTVPRHNRASSFPGRFRLSVCTQFAKQVVGDSVGRSQNLVSRDHESSPGARGLKRTVSATTVPPVQRGSADTKCVSMRLRAVRRCCRICRSAPAPSPLRMSHRIAACSSTPALF